MQFGTHNKKKSFFQIPPAKTILHHAAAWLVSACSLFGEIMPFGAALFAADYVSAPPRLTAILALLATLFPHFFPAATLKYALALSFFSLVVSKKGSYVLQTPLRRGALMGVCVFLSGLFMLLGGQLLVYDCFLLVLEAGITCAAVCLFAGARHVFSKQSATFAPGDILSVSALCGVAILGVSSLFSLYGLALTVPLSVLCIFLLTHENGMVAGAVSGTTLGLLATLESGNPVLGAFAVAGMAAGYFARYGRAGAALAFISANGLITFYTGGETEMVLNLAEVIAPALVYLSLPPGLLGRLWNGAEPEKFCPSRDGLWLSQALGEKAEAFSLLADTFTDISQKGLCNEGAARSAFFERAARKACDGCPKLNACWKKEFHRTYAAFFVLLEICHREGCVSAEDLPLFLEEKCIRKASLPDAIHQVYAIYKVDKLWESRMQETRTLVARQLSAVSHIFASMEKGAKTGLMENRVQEDILHDQLFRQNIVAWDLAVLQKRGTLFSVSLSTRAEPEVVRSAVSNALSIPMEITACHRGRFRLSPVQKVSLHLWGETMPRDGSEKSGDSFSSVYLDSGVHLVALSDGMGSGERARQDSRAAVTILKALFSAGFDTETAVGLVNSTLVLKSAEDSFATLDILLLNTHSLSGEFIKAGAASSFIRRGDKVHIFSAPSMPCGILASPGAARMETSFVPGDMVVMVSDGMQDPACLASDNTWLSEAIQNFQEADPRALARHLLALAREKSGGKLRDDLTVLCGKITENGGIVA